MTEASRSGEVARRRFRCPRCGSARVRRSAPRTPFEHLVRAVSPFHRFKCRDCEHRGWHLGRLPARRERVAPGGRPREQRDLRAARVRHMRLARSLLLTVALGVATGLYVQSCQQRSAATAP